MRKSKFMSVLTAIAMAGTMTLSAISLSATAYESTDMVSLALTSEKTSFTMEEVKAGDASTTVYVDVTNELDAADNVSCIEFEVWPSEWGAVDPVNLEFCEPNVLGTDKGNKLRHFDTNATLTGSVWTKEPTKAAFLNFASVEGFPGYGDDYPPKAIMMTSNATGKMRTGTEGAGEHLAQFDVEIPADAAEGTYTISLYKARASIGVISADENTMQNYEISNLKSIQITIGDDSSSTDPTDPSDPSTDPTDPSDPSTDPTDPSEGDGDDFLLGDANLDGKVNVRDCAFIASALAKGTAGDLPQKNADYNQDGKVNVRDAAALAADLAKGAVKS